jgi:hypothetical protein
MAQTLPRERFELLVVRNFRDADLDPALERIGAQLLFTAERPLGAKVALGLLRARGEVVTFLEDDDLYVPGRLGRALEPFLLDPRFGYWANGQTFVDEEGRPIADDRRPVSLRHLEEYSRIDADARHLGPSLGRLSRVDADFNLSSLAVRRSVLDAWRAELSNAEAAVDSLVYFAALAAGVRLEVTAERLTLYRVHAANESLLDVGRGEAALGRHARYVDRWLTCFAPVLARVRATAPRPVRRLAASAFYGTRVLRNVLDGRAPRIRVLSDLLRYAIASPMAKLRYRKDIPYYGILYLASPRRARRSYLRRRTGLGAPPSAPTNA